jgi:hypothetical protein
MEALLFPALISPRAIARRLQPMQKAAPMNGKLARTLNVSLRPKSPTNLHLKITHL